MHRSSLSRAGLEELARLGLLRSYIKEVILFDIAANNRLEDEQSGKLFEQFKARHNLSSEAELQAFAKENLLTLEDVRHLAERPISVQLHIQNHFQHKAEARFLERKDELDQVVYSLIRVSSESLARELHLQISEAEADFSTLAVKYSQGPERQTRGIIGPAPLNQSHPLLTQRLRAAKPGELLRPLQIEQWWVIVRLEQKLEASFDEATAQRMATELFELWLRDAVEQRVTGLSQQAEQP